MTWPFFSHKNGKEVCKAFAQRCSPSCFVLEITCITFSEKRQEPSETDHTKRLQEKRDLVLIYSVIYSILMTYLNVCDQKHKRREIRWWSVSWREEGDHDDPSLMMILMSPWRELQPGNHETTCCVFLLHSLYLREAFAFDLYFFLLLNSLSCPPLNSFPFSWMHLLWDISLQ